jgi:hypothetical protein
VLRDAWGVRYGTVRTNVLRCGTSRDERFARIDLQATAVGGLAYLLAVAWFRWRG